jgi:hypothetical protein
MQFNELIFTFMQHFSFNLIRNQLFLILKEYLSLIIMRVIGVIIEFISMIGHLTFKESL